MNKYKAKRTLVDGIVFHSRREANRYKDINMLLQAGLISNLRLQPRYPLMVDGKLICTYIGDFEYLDKKKGRFIVEDCKGFRTQTYRLKKALFQALYNKEILET